MAERINTPFTSEHFVAWCLSMLGQPYWYGTTVARCTNDLLTRKTDQYPTRYTDGRMSRYRADIAAGKVCADCIGAFKGYCWNGGKKKADVPDRSANGMLSYARSKGLDWGVLGTMPELPGIAVRYDGHVGYYVGGGYVIEWRGFAFGCVKTRLSERGWTHWNKLPQIDYRVQTVTQDTGAASLGSRLLRKGCTCVDVRILQELLMTLGHDLGA